MKTELRLPRGLYDEALETYESIRPIRTNRRWAVYNLNPADTEHLFHMARCHLEAQAIDAGESDQRQRCRRYLQQLDEAQRVSLILERNHEGEGRGVAASPNPSAFGEQQGQERA